MLRPSLARVVTARVVTALFVALALPACDLSLDGLFAECDSDSDCDDDEECNDDGECEELECTEDSDCDPGEECRRDECRRISCTLDDECGEGAFCDLTDGKCREIPSGEGEGEGGEGEGGEGEGGEGEGGEGEGGEGEGDPCFGVPPEGQCNGDIIEACVGGAIDTFNCNAAPFPVGQTDCVFASTGRAECAVRTGSQCILNGGTEVALCQGSGAGCRLDDVDSGSCDTGVGACTASDVQTCNGSRFVVDCFAGQPLHIDCGALGGTCDFGCQFEGGEPCIPEISLCDGVTTCPANGVCPGGGGGSFTHNTGTGITFTNDRPSDTSSLQGAIDACNAHFGATTCSQACPESDCETVTLNGLCDCAATHVWNYGGGLCFGGGTAGTVTGGNCSSTIIGNWN